MAIPSLYDDARSTMLDGYRVIRSKQFRQRVRAIHVLVADKKPVPHPAHTAHIDSVGGVALGLDSLKKQLFYRCKSWA